jgi:hypothetical protein
MVAFKAGVSPPAVRIPIRFIGRPFKLRNHAGA